MFYSAKTCGFYDPQIHGDNMPADVVEITKVEYVAILELQSQGKVITSDDQGRPIVVDPAVLPPPATTPAQGLVALFTLKQITEDHVLQAIAKIPDPVQQYTARIGYQHATTWERNSPTMQTMAQLLHLSEQDLDDLFTYAVTVQV